MDEEVRAELDTMIEDIEDLSARVSELEREREQEPDPLAFGTEIFREGQRAKARALKRR